MSNLSFKELKIVYEQFLSEFRSFGIAASGIDYPTNDMFTIFFESKEEMEQFPFKEETYKGIKINKKICGKIQAL